MTLDLRDRIRDVPDFPTEGVIFKDLMPLIADPTYFAESIRQLADWARPREPELVFGAEARGFIFGSALAYELGAGFETGHHRRVRLVGGTVADQEAPGQHRLRRARAGEQAHESQRECGKNGDASSMHRWTSHREFPLSSVRRITN